MAECRSVLASAQRTIVLAFELVDASADRLPELAREALASKEVAEAIRKAMEREAKALLKEHPEALRGEPVQLDPEKGTALARSTLEAALKAGGSHLAGQVESSPEGKRLRKEAEQLLEDFKCSPAGAWVDRNKKLLIVVGAVTAVGTGVAFYLTRWGDPAASLVEGKALSFSMGKLKFEGKLTKFEPSSQTVGAQVTLSGPLGTPVSPGPGGAGQPGRAAVTVAGLAKGESVEASGEGAVFVPIARSLTGVLSLRADYRNAIGGGPTGVDRPQVLTLSPAIGLRVVDSGLKLDVLAGASVDLLSPSALPFAEASLSYERRFGPIRATVSGGLQLNAPSRFGAPGLFRAAPPAPLGSPAALFRDESAALRLGGTLTLTFP